MTDMLVESTLRQRFTVTGVVQGVGFRWWTKAQADDLGLAGSATNTSDGHVEVVADRGDGVEVVGDTDSAL